MKKIILLLCFSLLSFGLAENASAQAIRTNVPFTLAGSPNLGVEFTLGQQFSVGGDVLWMPYMTKRTQEVFRTTIGTAEFRYYINPRYYYTNDMFDGLYTGVYAMYGNYNVGLLNGKQLSTGGNIDNAAKRYTGWGVSSGLVIGYKMYLSQRFRIDFNLGVGYAHLQYDVYLLGGENAQYPIERKNTRGYIGPTRVGINLVYNIFK